MATLFELSGIIDVAMPTKLFDQMDKIPKVTQIGEQEALKMRGAFLFLSFGMMAMASLIDRLNKRFIEMRQNMRSTWKVISAGAMEVSTILVGTGEHFDAVAEKMMELGRETEWTARQAGEAMSELARAGLSVAETFEAVDYVLRLATAANLELAQAADITTGAILGWNERLDENVDVQALTIDATVALSSAALSSRTTVEQLAEGLKYATASARMLGWEFEEVTAALMVSADNMIRAGIAGRSLRRMMSRLAMIAGDSGTSIEHARDMLEEYNIEIMDAEGNVKGMIEIMEALNEGTKELTATERAQLYATVANMRAMDQMYHLTTNEGIDALKEYTTMIRISQARVHMMEEGFINHREAFDDMVQSYIQNSKEMGVSIEDAVVDQRQLQEDWEVSAETAASLASAIETATLYTDQYADALENSTMLTEVQQNRLQTLDGSVKLLTSSVDNLWAVLGMELAPVFTLINDLTREIANVLAELPRPMRLMLAVIIVSISLLGQLVSKGFMFLASIYMITAAASTYTLTAKKANLNNKKLAFSFGAVSFMAKEAGRELLIAAQSLGVYVAKMMTASMGFMMLIEGWRRGERKLKLVGVALLATSAALHIFRHSIESVNIGLTQFKTATVYAAGIGGLTLLIHGLQTGNRMFQAMGIILTLLTLPALFRMATATYSLITAKAGLISSVIMHTKALMTDSFVRKQNISWMKAQARASTDEAKTIAWKIRWRYAELKAKWANIKADMTSASLKAKLNGLRVKAIALMGFEEKTKIALASTTSLLAKAKLVLTAANVKLLASMGIFVAVASILYHVLEPLPTVLRLVAAAVIALAVAKIFLNVALWASPIIWAIMAIVGLILVVVELERRFGLLGRIVNVVSAVFRGIVSGIKSVVNWFREGGKWANRLRLAFIIMIGPLYLTYRVLRWIIEAIAGVVHGNSPGLIDLVKLFIKFTNPIIIVQKQLEILHKIFRGIISVVRTLFSALNRVLRLFSRFDVGIPGLSAIQNMIGGIGDALGGLADRAKGVGSSIASGLGFNPTLIGLADNALSRIRQMMGGITDEMGMSFGGLEQRGQPTFLGSPQITINATANIGEDITPEEYSDLIKKASEEALDEWGRRFRKEL